MAQQRLLLIDENRQLLAMVGDYLCNLGYEVHRAGESDEAEALLRNYEYSIVITGTEWEDFGGPGQNLTQCIKNLAYRPRIIRLEETHSSPQSDISLEDDATQVIEKPISLLRLGNITGNITPNLCTAFEELKRSEEGDLLGTELAPRIRIP